MKGHPGGLEHSRYLHELSFLPAGSRWLDMGAGDGETVRLLKELGNDAMGIGKQIGTVNLGQIVWLASKQGNTLVPGHMEARNTAVGILPRKIYNGGFHASSDSATCIMTAHSMRFLNSSQPYWYTPPMLPVAWYAFAAQPPEQYILAQQSRHSSLA